jgi:hypothetical protein
VRTIGNLAQKWRIERIVIGCYANVVLLAIAQLALCLAISNPLCDVIDDIATQFGNAS